MVPKAVLTAFGACDKPTPLAGGMGTCWRSGDLVLKPATNIEGSEWIAVILESVPQNGFSIPANIRASNGKFVFDSWTCTRYWEGFTPKGTHFSERLAASLEFHAAIAHLGKPKFVDHRTDPWATAHDVVFNNRPWIPHPDIIPTIKLLNSIQNRVCLSNQVVHGDISGNYIFAPNHPPAIIDFTPYWAPTGFGEAVLVVDVVVWEKMDLKEIFPKVAHIPEILQLLVRATHRRLLEYDCHFQAGARYTHSIVWQPDYHQLTDQIATLIQSE